MRVRAISIYLLGLIFLAALACLAIYAYIYIGTRPYVYSSVSDVPTTTVALVLGASITGNGILSTVLEERADKAIELYQAGKVSKILVTGDDATLSHNEVDPVGRYLLAHGVPQSDIYLDHAGFDTYSSMYRARDVFGVTDLTIVSQAFHLPRAIFIARSLGLSAVGVEASSGGVYLFNYLREIPASVKAVYDIIFARVPKYLGQQFPITGDGSATWVGSTTPQ